MVCESGTGCYLRLRLYSCLRFSLLTRPSRVNRRWRRRSCNGLSTPRRCPTPALGSPLPGRRRWPHYFVAGVEAAFDTADGICGALPVVGDVDAGVGSTRNGPIAITRQLRSRVPQSPRAPSTAACSLRAPKARPGAPPVPTATALQPAVTLPRRRATSLLSSGRMREFVFAWKNPVTFIVVGIATTKRSSRATIIHGTPWRPHHSSALRMTSSELDAPVM